MWMYVVRLPECSSKVLIAAALRKVTACGWASGGAGGRECGPISMAAVPNEGGA